MPAAGVARAAAVIAAGTLLPAGAAAQSLQPAGWDKGVRLAEAVDRHPDPDIVEVGFTARVARVELEPGLEVEAWTYNGTIPGPIFHCHILDHAEGGCCARCTSICRSRSSGTCSSIRAPGEIVR